MAEQDCKEGYKKVDGKCIKKRKSYYSQGAVSRNTGLAGKQVAGIIMLIVAGLLLWFKPGVRECTLFGFNWLGFLNLTCQGSNALLNSVYTIGGVILIIVSLFMIIRGRND